MRIVNSIKPLTFGSKPDTKTLDGIQRLLEACFRQAQITVVDRPTRSNPTAQVSFFRPQNPIVENDKPVYFWVVPNGQVADLNHIWQIVKALPAARPTDQEHVVKIGSHYVGCWGES